MNNPFFGALGGGNGFMQMLQQFQQFRANFQGNPKAEVDKLLPIWGYEPARVKPTSIYGKTVRAFIPLILSWPRFDK